MRARNANNPAAPIHGRDTPPVPGSRPAASLCVLALILVAGAACVPSATTGGGTGPAATTGGGATPAGSAAPLPAAPGAQPAPDPAVAGAKARVEAALNSAVAGGAKPATDQIRAALTAAGFAPEQAEVTAGRTPTGLDAPAVEAAVRVGGECIVGQVRTGSVVVTVFPVLSDGRCLVGTRA